MSEASITIIVAGLVQITIIVVGFLTMWVKVKYGTEKATNAAATAATTAATAATKAEVIERKLDDNTVATKSVDKKADTIVKQTNGTMEQIRLIIEGIAARVDKLEEYNHQSNHRQLDVLNAIHLKLMEVSTRNSPGTTTNDKV